MTCMIRNQLLIMILKIFKTSLGRAPYKSLLRTSSFLMSNDDDNKKGFGKFKRKASPSDKRQEQPLKAPQKEPEKSPKIENNQQKPQNATGFSKFKRQSGPKSSKPQQKPTQATQKGNDPEKPQPVNKTAFKSEQSPKQPVENKAQSQKGSESLGFTKFKRNSHGLKQNLNQIKNQPKVEPKVESVDSEKKEENKQAEKPINNFESSFKNFKRGRKKTSLQTLKSEPKKDQKSEEIKNNNVFEQRKEQANKPKPQEQKADPFSSFKIRSKKQKTPKQEKKSESINAINQEKPSEKPPRPLQEIQKEEEEFDLKRKQELFKRKIQEYRNLKAQEQAKPKYQQIFQQTRAKIAQQIYKLTGIDINAEIQPPKWVKTNPILLPLFMRWRLILLGFLLFLLYESYEQYIEEINSQQFINFIETGQTIQIRFEESSHDTETEIGKKTRTYAIIHLKNGQLYKTISNTEFQNLIKNKVNILNSINTTEPIFVSNGKREVSNMLGNLRFIMSMAMVYLFFSSLLGAGKAGPGKMGSKNANLFSQSKSKRFQQKVHVKFDDVVGMQKSKEEIVEFIDFLSSPEKYHKLGAKIPRGALLTGPPGTGKTMIAKACAGESNVPFFTISGSQFIEMYVGVGAQRVRDLFAQARKAAPSIIFIDQIDAVGKKRSAGFGGGNDERDNTLNQLLVEMDGFEANSNVIVFAATNQKDVLDPALTRPGRFDRLIEVDLPDIEGRKQIFMVHLRPIVIDSESSMEDYARRMATLTPGFSGADIKNLCNEAAIMAARNGNKFVTIHDFELATQRVIAGIEKKSHLITEETRRVVAYHQCGHGVVSWFLEGANPLLKLTIIPRSKGSLGFAQYLPHETQISNKRQLEDQICVILAGRVSEEVFFGRISTGAYDDLQKAYNIAKSIVTQYGMNQKLGWLTYEQSEYAKYYSKETQRLIDIQITRIIKQCTERTRNLINQKRELIDKLAQKLLEVQTIDLTKISQILGARPFKPNKQYQEYLNEHTKMVEEGKKDQKKNDGNNDGNSGGIEGKKEESVIAMKSGKIDYLL